MKRFVMKKDGEYYIGKPARSGGIQSARVYGETTPEQTKAWGYGFRPEWVSVVEAGEIDRLVSAAFTQGQRAGYDG